MPQELVALNKDTKLKITKALETIKEENDKKPGQFPVKIGFDDSNGAPALVMLVDVKKVTTNTQLVGLVNAAIDEDRIVAPPTRGTEITNTKGEKIKPWDPSPHYHELSELATRSKAGNYLEAQLKKSGIAGASVEPDLALQATAGGLVTGSKFSGRFEVTIPLRSDDPEQVEALLAKVTKYVAKINAAPIKDIAAMPSGYEPKSVAK